MVQGIMEHINDVARLCIVYIHILAVSVAIGTIFLADVRFITGRLDNFSILCTKNVILYALIVLYITGTMIIYIDNGTLFVDLTTMPKLSAKLFVVGLLTLNGFILHHYIIPMFLSLSSLTPKQRAVMGMSAAFSAVSWCYAIFLGKAKPLVSFLGLNDFIELYLLIVSVSMTVGAFIMVRHTAKENIIFLIKESFYFIKKIVLNIIYAIEYSYNFCLKYVLRRDVFVQACIIFPVISLCTYIVMIMLENSGVIGSSIVDIKEAVPLVAFNEKNLVQNVNIALENENHSNFSNETEVSLEEEGKKIIFVSLAENKEPVFKQKKENYILQLSASRSQNHAKQYVRELLQKYKNSFVQYPIRIVSYKKGSSYWHRVRIHGLSYYQGKSFCMMLHLKECFLIRAS